MAFLQQSTFYSRSGFRAFCHFSQISGEISDPAKSRHFGGFPVSLQKKKEIAATWKVILHLMRFPFLGNAPVKRRLHFSFHFAHFKLVSPRNPLHQFFKENWSYCAAVNDLLNDALLRRYKERREPNIQLNSNPRSLGCEECALPPFNNCSASKILMY